MKVAFGLHLEPNEVNKVSIVRVEYNECLLGFPFEFYFRKDTIF